MSDCKIAGFCSFEHLLELPSGMKKAVLPNATADVAYVLEQNPKAPLSLS